MINQNVIADLNFESELTGYNMTVAGFLLVNRCVDLIDELHSKDPTLDIKLKVRPTDAHNDGALRTDVIRLCFADLEPLEAFRDHLESKNTKDSCIFTYHGDINGVPALYLLLIKDDLALESFHNRLYEDKGGETGSDNLVVIPSDVVIGLLDGHKKRVEDMLKKFRLK